jgi:NAD(P)-dependent dehydrogenase (short-subunit alcohol dehydrogenase family)
VELEGPGAPARVEVEEARELGRTNDWDVVFCDLADAAVSRALVEYVRERHGRLDCLVNNAATWTYGPALAVTDEQWRHVLEVNVIAPVRLVRDAFDQGKVVGAICHAGWMLASAGVVRNRTVTSFRSIKDDMVNAGGNWVDREVVRDGNLVTSRTPADLPAFMRTIIGALRERRASGGETQAPERPVALVV